MSDPLMRHLEIASSHDDEIDAIGLCVEAILQIAPKDARERIVRYLNERFGARDPL